MTYLNKYCEKASFFSFLLKGKKGAIHSMKGQAGGSALLKLSGINFDNNILVKIKQSFKKFFVAKVISSNLFSYHKSMCIFF